MNDGADGIGDILTGGLFARTLDRVRGAGKAGHADPHESAGGTCLNCGAVRAGSFCQACGQGGHVHRNIVALGHDILHGVFHFEGRIWQTLPLLALHPGELTRRYVHGERQKFVSPMALFLFSVFLLAAAVNRIDMPDIASATQGLARAKAQMSDASEKAQDKLSDLTDKRSDRLSDDPKANVADLDKQIADATREVAVLKAASDRIPSDAKGAVRISQVNAAGQTVNVDVASLEDLPTHTGAPSLDAQIDHVKRNPQLYAYKLQSASYKFSWALIPISLPFIWLLFCWRRDVGLYDHAIFAFHSLSFMTLLAVGLIGLYLLGVRPVWLWIALFVVPPIHIYKQLKGAYLIGRIGAAWRTVALLLMTTITSLLFFLLLLWLES